MAEPRRGGAAALEVRGLNVFYGASHALQGVDLRLDSGALSVVGRNGMGKTTLCKAIMGLVPVASGTILFQGQPINGKNPAEIARMGLGYVPQGRRLWRSLTVDEHLKMVATKGGAWSIERIYATFPRLAERKSNGGGQLSGGEQQMLAISRALLMNPKLLVMDEPTEGLAPVIVTQVEDMLVRLADEGDIDILVIEQNIGVACGIADTVAIMVNGRINRTASAQELASDRALQQRLLGVGRHSDAPSGAEPAAAGSAPGEPRASENVRAPGAAQPLRIWSSNPKLPNRWSQALSYGAHEKLAKLVTTAAHLPSQKQAEIRPLAVPGGEVVLVAGTLDTKGAELRYMRDLIRSAGLPVRLVDLSTTQGSHGAEIPAHQIAAFHPRGASGVFTGDRGAAVAGMTEAFERWIRRQQGIAGVISAGGSGGTALVAPAMRALPIGIPKLIVSTVASGEVGKYVGAADITMMHSVADVQGLNAITEEVLGNAAHAMVGMVQARKVAKPKAARKPAMAMSMFGVTTPLVQQLSAQLAADWDCLVFHATGIGGQSMEKLIDGGQVKAVIDTTTTEVADMLFGGVLPATPDRFGAVIRKRIPWIGSVGALDMVNFGAPDTIPAEYRHRLFYTHNPQVTLMRTTPAECAEIGRWIAGRLNEMEGQVRLLLPEAGISALDVTGQPFFDPAARTALFTALENTLRATPQRQVQRLPYHINSPQFAAALLAAFNGLHGAGRVKRPSKDRGDASR